MGIGTNVLDSYEVIRRLKADTLIIRTIPGEEWTLSCYRHKTLLVDVYQLTGQIAGKRGVHTWECGRLCELLIRLLRTERKIYYRTYGKQSDNVSLYTRSRVPLASTLEEDMLLRLREGDFIFHATGEAWILSNTYFGTSSHGQVFCLAKESTLHTPNLRIYKGMDLEHTLLSFLCQQSEFTEADPSNIVAFQPKGEQ